MPYLWRVGSRVLIPHRVCIFFVEFPSRFPLTVREDLPRSRHNSFSSGTLDDEQDKFIFLCIALKFRVTSNSAAESNWMSTYINNRLISLDKFGSFFFFLEEGSIT